MKNKLQYSHFFLILFIIWLLMISNPSLVLFLEFDLLSLNPFLESQPSRLENVYCGKAIKNQCYHHHTIYMHLSLATCTFHYSLGFSWKDFWLWEKEGWENPSTTLLAFCSWISRILFCKKKTEKKRKEPCLSFIIAKRITFSSL